MYIYIYTYIYIIYIYIYIYIYVYIYIYRYIVRLPEGTNRNWGLTGLNPEHGTISPTKIAGFTYWFVRKQHLGKFINHMVTQDVLDRDETNAIAMSFIISIGVRQLLPVANLPLYPNPKCLQPVRTGPNWVNISQLIIGFPPSKDKNSRYSHRIFRTWLAPKKKISRVRKYNDPKVDVLRPRKVFRRARMKWICFNNDGFL